MKIYFGYYQICLDNDERPDRLVFLAAEDLEEYYFLINEDNSVSKEVYFSDVKNNIIDELHSDNFLEFLLKELPKNYRELR